MASSLDRPMMVQEITLKIAYNPAKYDAPVMWDWSEIVDTHRDCQIIRMKNTVRRPAFKKEEQAIMEWDND